MRAAFTLDKRDKKLILYGISFWITYAAYSVVHEAIVDGRFLRQFSNSRITETCSEYNPAHRYECFKDQVGPIIESSAFSVNTFVNLNAAGVFLAIKDMKEDAKERALFHEVDIIDANMLIYRELQSGRYRTRVPVLDQFVRYKYLTKTRASLRLLFKSVELGGPGLIPLDSDAISRLRSLKTEFESLP